MFGLWEELGSRFRGLRVKGLRVWDLGFKVRFLKWSIPRQNKLRRLSAKADSGPIKS